MKPAKFQLIAITSAFFMLGGCVTNGNQYTWTKSQGNNIEQERAQADSECLARSYEAFRENPMPDNTCIGTCIDTKSGISKGFMAGTAARQNREVREARERFYESCMMGKGWQKQSVQ